MTKITSKAGDGKAKQTKMDKRIITQVQQFIIKRHGHPIINGLIYTSWSALLNIARLNPVG